MARPFHLPLHSPGAILSEGLCVARLSFLIRQDPRRHLLDPSYSKQNEQGERERERSLLTFKDLYRQHPKELRKCIFPFWVEETAKEKTTLSYRVSLRMKIL